MDEREVREYAERSESIVDASPRMDEENTKVKLIQPFIDLLGWDLYSSEVRLEYSVQIGTGHPKVDYALLLGDTPVVFIEAKGCNSSISDRDVSQLRSYMRQELDVDWGLVTNGKSFEILTKDRNSDKGKEISIVKFDLDDLKQNPDILEILSKESIKSGKSDEIVSQIARANEAIQYLKRNRERVAEKLGGVLTDEIGASTPINTEAQATEFVDDLVSALEEQRRVIGDRSKTGEITTPPPEPSTEGGYEIVFSRDGELLASFNDNRQSGLMVEVVDYLIDGHDLISKVEPLPYVPGRKKAIINDQPTYPNGEKEMMTYHELTGGYYLDTHMNKAGKKRELRRLAERCGLTVEFDGDW